MIRRDYMYLLSLFIYLFALYPEETSSHPFLYCALETTRVGELRYEQIIVAKEVTSNL